MSKGPTWTLSDDYKTLNIDFPSDPPVRLKLSAEQVDDLLKNVGEMRIAMQPQHPMDFAFGQKVNAIADPRWVTEPEIMRGNSLLHLRHPGFGWLSFLIPSSEAAKLSRFLQAQVEGREEQEQRGTRH